MKLTQEQKKHLQGLSERLREIASELGSQAAAARLAGISERQMRMYLAAKNRPKAVTLARLAVASGWNLEWIISGAGPKKYSEKPRSLMRAIVGSPSALKLGGLGEFPELPESMRAFGQMAEQLQAIGKATEPAREALKAAGPVLAAIQSIDALRLGTAYEAARQMTLLLEKIETSFGEIYGELTDTEKDTVVGDTIDLICPDGVIPEDWQRLADITITSHRQAVEFIRGRSSGKAEAGARPKKRKR